MNICRHTIDIQFVQMRFQRQCAGLVTQKLGLDNIHDPRADNVELRCKLRNIELPSLSVRLVEYVFTIAPEGGSLTDSNETQNIGIGDILLRKVNIPELKVELASMLQCPSLIGPRQCPSTHFESESSSCLKNTAPCDDSRGRVP